MTGGPYDRLRDRGPDLIGETRVDVCDRTAANSRFMRLRRDMRGERCEQTGRQDNSPKDSTKRTVSSGSEVRSAALTQRFLEVPLRLFPGAADLEPVVHAQDAVDMGELLRLLLLSLRIDGPFQECDAVIDLDLDVIVLEVRRLLELRLDLLLLLRVSSGRALVGDDSRTRPHQNQPGRRNGQPKPSSAHRAPPYCT